MMSEQPGNVAEVIPQEIGMRVIYGLIVTVLPVLCFSIGANFRPEWQKGTFDAYGELLLNIQSTKFFFPLILYSVICMTILLVGPQRFSVYFAVRLGIYSGIPLAFQYILILWTSGQYPFFIIWGVFLIALVFGLGKLTVSFKTWAKIIVGLGLFIAVLFFAPIQKALPAGIVGDFINDLIQNLVMFFYGFLAIVLAASLYMAPALCFWVMSSTAMKLFRQYERPFVVSFWHGTSLATWLAGFTTAWIFSIQEMFKIYATLPKTPPQSGCYVVTAAAQGHPGFVGSQPVPTSSGIIWVNRQLQTLKCAELALQALAPRFHRLLRAFYNVVGPALARRLTHPILADVAYLSLKPAELLARFTLRFIIPNLDEYASRLYR